MTLDLNTVDIYIWPGRTDMRKQIIGLASIVQDEMELDPFSPSVFLFCNRERKILKAFYWDKNGFCLWCYPASELYRGRHLN